MRWSVKIVTLTGFYLIFIMRYAYLESLRVHSPMTSLFSEIILYIVLLAIITFYGIFYIYMTAQAVSKLEVSILVFLFSLISPLWVISYEIQVVINDMFLLVFYGLLIVYFALFGKEIMLTLAADIIRKEKDRGKEFPLKIVKHRMGLLPYHLIAIAFLFIPFIKLHYGSGS
jgi:hypothetical protein